MDADKNKDTLEQLLQGEVSTLRKLNGQVQHKNLMRVLEIYDDEKKYYLITELLPEGTLLSHANRIKKQSLSFDENEYRVRDIVR